MSFLNDIVFHVKSYSQMQLMFQKLAMIHFSPIAIQKIIVMNKMWR